MKLIKVTMDVALAEAFRPWLEMRDMLRAVSGKPSIELQGPPFIIDVAEKKQRVELRFRAIKMEQEGMGSLEDSATHVVDLLTKVSNVVSLPTIRQMKCDAIFIEPYTLPFHELLLLIKKRYLRPNSLVDSATDIGLVIDQHEGETVKHIQIGPMEAEQLRSMFLRWPGERLPEQFIFLGLGYEQKREIPCELNHVRDFLQAALTWQRNQAEISFRDLSKGEE